MPNTTEHAKSLAAEFALSFGKRRHYASGGGITEPVVTGPILGADPGRTDTRAVSVPAGSFVIPADVVSGIPSAQGNSLAGHSALAKLFNSLPLLPDEAPYGSNSPKLARGRTMPGLMNVHHVMAGSFDKSKGGPVRDGHSGHVPIMAADGEFVVSPEHVRRLGLGNLERGHAILDQFVDEARKRNIRDLKKLPGTVKDGTK